eukprot:598213-Lingulodinium_polyedra.AAC.1
MNPNTAGRWQSGARGWPIGGRHDYNSPGLRGANGHNQAKDLWRPRAKLGARRRRFKSGDCH